MHRVIAGLMVAFLCVGAWAQELVEGRDYTRVRPSQLTTSSKNQVEVIEFFSYQCPHCFEFSPALEEWAGKLPADVAFRRESVSIGYKQWEPAARTFYSLQVMGKLEALDAAIFNAIHKQGVRFQDQPSIESWMADNHVPVADFRSVYTSFGVDSKLKRGDALSRSYKIPAVPSITIDGKYLVAIASNVDFKVQLARIDALIAKARVERKATVATRK